MTHLTNTQLLTLTVLLKDEKRQLNQHFDNDTGTTGAAESETESVGELSAYDNHPADLGTETFERGRDMAIDTHLASQREEIQSALQRIKDGEYGICEVCGETIPYERLQALPATTRCIDHASDTIAEDRPVEEEVMTIQSAPARFDDADAWKSVSSYGNASRTVQPDKGQ
ncbi:YteA family regulatory protein [Paenibacillus phyllosphaerae]|uniref:YteA family regulatory protein n=1 Tax=Paenibacillus phyllosphaerae TaxID=274593 RepID=A0A7W5AZ59_9BACL|nr:TraR/DksA C4-type zinc finger protein [Paenibacillus phyllosphaerae]MBB3111144.1 YteA family regulatory protein [Paenibacillus phyllosphaerae]